MTQTRKTYSASFKAEVVREILRETRSISQIAAQHGIHPNQLYLWRDQALAGLPGLFNDQAGALWPSSRPPMRPNSTRSMPKLAA